MRRDILWDGFTIINCPSRGCASTLGGTAGSIGLVVVDPVARARAAAEFLVARGFSAPVVTDAEPEIPICFVVTDALMGVALNFRKRALRFPHPLPLHG